MRTVVLTMTEQVRSPALHCYHTAVGYIDLGAHAAGLDSDRLRYYGKLISEMYPELELRRIPHDDRIMAWATQQAPPHTFGIWERNVGTHAFGGVLTNWVFTLPEQAIDDRIIARLLEADMRRQGADERTAKMEALRRTKLATEQANFMRKFEERRDEMIALGRMAGTQSTIRHTIGGEDVIISDVIRPARTIVK